MGLTRPGTGQDRLSESVFVCSFGTYLTLTLKSVRSGDVILQGR